MRSQQSDDSILEILFDILGTYSTLRITLPSNFPISKPFLKIIGPAMHPWLDSNQVVIGSPKLHVWSKTSSLKDVVIETLNALQSATNHNTAALNHQASSISYNSYPNGNMQKPIKPITSSSSSSSYPAADYKQSQNQQQGNNNMYQQQQQHIQQQQNGYVYNEYNEKSSNGNNNVPKSSSSSSLNVQSIQSTKKEPEKAFDEIHVPIPEIPLSFSELERLSDIQLERLLSDKEALKAHMQNIAGVSIYRKLREEHRKTNEEIALETLSMEEELLKIEREVTILKKQLGESVLSYKQTLADINRKYGTSKEELYRILEGQLNSLDDTSESLSKSFINGEIAITDFVDEYKKLRTEFHLLDSKLKLCLKR